MGNKRQTLDREMILAYGIMAFMASMCVIFLSLTFLGIDIHNVDSTSLLAIFAIMTGGIWGFLLCRNC